MTRRVMRSGFALAAVLWVLTIASVLAAGTALVGRSAYDASRNRVNQERAYWAVEGCVAELRSLADAALASGTPPQPTQVWRNLDRAIDSLPLLVPLRCDVSMTAVGSAIDLNASSDILLRKFFRNAAGLAEGDALTDALLDWRDPDDDPRVDGAERTWYEANSQPAPRNDSLPSVQELSLVRGMSAHVDLWPFLTVENARICLTTAPAPVLAALPGFVDETVKQVLADRARGVFFNNFGALESELSPTAADSLRTHLAELAALTSADPAGWIIRVTAAAGSPAVSVTTELRLDRVGSRAVVLHRQTQ